MKVLQDWDSVRARAILIMMVMVTLMLSYCLIDDFSFFNLVLCVFVWISLGMMFVFMGGK